MGGIVIVRCVSAKLFLTSSMSLGQAGSSSGPGGVGREGCLSTEEDAGGCWQMLACPSTTPGNQQFTIGLQVYSTLQSCQRCHFFCKQDSRIVGRTAGPGQLQGAFLAGRGPLLQPLLPSLPSTLHPPPLTPPRLFDLGNHPSVCQTLCSSLFGNDSL